MNANMNNGSSNITPVNNTSLPKPRNVRNSSEVPSNVAQNVNTMNTSMNGSSLVNVQSVGTEAVTVNNYGNVKATQYSNPGNLQGNRYSAPGNLLIKRVLHKK